MNPATMTERLLNWFADHARDLSWRRERTPYRVWLAEVMLQQTRAGTVGPYYERFLARFPTLEALAAAPLEDVLRVWEGLGYYARARNLHDTARQIVKERGGRLPETARELRRLPGVGEYIANAVASIAFGHPVAAVDGNVRRVLARLFAVAGDPLRPPARQRLDELAASLLPPDRAGLFNEALMELGAAVCRPRRPRCDDCPLAGDCQAHRAGQEEAFPTRAPRRVVPHHQVAAGILRDADGRVLVACRAADDFLGGLWEFPGGGQEEGESLQECLARELREELGIEVEIGPELLVMEHAYTHFRITLHVFECRLRGGTPRCLECADVRWVAPAELDALPMSVTDRRIARAIVTAGHADW